jgi:hypothetical protein
VNFGYFVLKKFPRKTWEKHVFQLKFRQLCKIKTSIRPPPPPPPKTLITIIHLFILWCIRIFWGRILPILVTEKLGKNIFLNKKFAIFL